MTALIVLSFELVNIFYVLPVTEGWWETYAWLGGPSYNYYSYIGLKFPPLFTIFTKYLYSIFNGTFIYLRIFFLFISAATIFLTYSWLSHCFSRLASAIGVLVAFMFVVNNPVYMVKDYHTFLAFLVSLIFYMISLSHSTHNKVINYLILFTIGLISGFLLLVKQNIGVFFTLGIFAFFLISNERTVDLKTDISTIIKKTLVGIFAFIIPIILLHTKAPYMLNQLFNNDSKGSVSTVLFRFLLDKNLLSYLIASIAIILVFGVTKFALNSGIYNADKISSKNISAFIYFIIFIIVLGSIKYNIIIISTALAWPILHVFIRDLYINPTYYKHTKYYWVLLLAYAYCGTNTAGYNFVSTDFLIAFCIANLANISINYCSNTTLINYASIVFVVTISLMVSAPKLISGIGYNWWGLKSGNIITSTCNLPYPELQLIKTDKNTFDIFKSVKDVAGNLPADEFFFSYPSIPIFYLLEGKKITFPPVLWFDVSSSNDGKYTVEYFNNCPPEYIFWLKPPRFVYNGHFSLRKADPAMLYTDNWIKSSIRTNKYHVIKVIPTFDQNFSYKTKEFNRSISQSKFDAKSNSDAVKICDELDDCLEKSNVFMFSSGTDYDYFIRHSKHIYESDDHIFYILKRTDTFD